MNQLKNIAVLAVLGFVFLGSVQASEHTEATSDNTAITQENKADGHKKAHVKKNHVKRIHKTKDSKAEAGAKGNESLPESSR